MVDPRRSWGGLRAPKLVEGINRTVDEVLCRAHRIVVDHIVTLVPSATHHHHKELKILRR